MPAKAKKPAKTKVAKAVAKTVEQQIVARLEKKGNTLSRAVGTVIPSLGQLAGNYLGGPTGGAVGMAAGKLISAITGFGDYKVNKNTIIQGNTVPTFQNGGDGMRVCHREFLADVVGSTDFNLQAYPINPGMATTFPWLSLVAANFEEYEMDGLVFEFRPSSGSAVSNTSSALGVVILATDYDSANGNFTDKQSMESYEYATSTVPFTGTMHPVECMRSKNVLDNLYTRTGANPEGTDIRMYDMGVFQIATEGMQSAYTVGELWVTYSAKLRKPRLPTVGPPGAYLHVQESPTNASVYNMFFGANGAVATSESTMQLGTDWFPYNTTGIVLQRPGWYYLAFYVSEANVATTNMTVGYGSNITLGPNIFADTLASSLNFQVNNVSYADIADVRTVLVSANGDQTTNYIVANYDTSSVSGGYVDCFVWLISRGLPTAPRPVLQRRLPRFGPDLRRIPRLVEEDEEWGERKEQKVAPVLGKPTARGK